MVKAFPKSQFYGYDLFDPNIDKCKQNAEDKGVTNNINFIQSDVSKKLDQKFDFVASFDLIHVMTYPIEGLRTIRKADKDDGIFV